MWLQRPVDLPIHVLDIPTFLNTNQRIFSSLSSCLFPLPTFFGLANTHTHTYIFAHTHTISVNSLIPHCGHKMANSITIAWATPVDAATLGARMEAHAESKATIHIFRLCVQHAPPGAPLGQLPPELVEIVAAQIQQPRFEKRMKKWEMSVNCAAGNCSPSEHSKIMYNSIGYHGHRQEILYNSIGYHGHLQAVETFLPKVEDNSFIEKSDKFAKCRKVCDPLKCGKHLTLNADICSGLWS